MSRQRADELLVAQGLFGSVEQASRAILAGQVVVDYPHLTAPLKPGTSLPADATVRLAKSARRGKYVSRGGEKLEGALSAFGYDPAGANALDAGASTGGFTDCLLQHGAVRVSAVDVGYGQLAWSLREDPRVDVYDRTNIREVGPADIGGPFDLAVADLSFISLSKVAAPIGACLTGGGTFIALVKPQFEAEQADVGTKGVVGDPDVHVSVLQQSAADLKACGLEVKGVAYSPITGPEGNIEFWIEAVKGGGNSALPAELESEIERVVREAHVLHRTSREPKGRP